MGRRIEPEVVLVRPVRNRGDVGILIKAPPGDYSVTASLIGGSGQSPSADFSGGGGAQKEITLTFLRPPASN